MVTKFDWEIKHHICQRMNSYVSGRTFESGKEGFVKVLELHKAVAASITLQEFKDHTGATIEQ